MGQTKLQHNITNIYNNGHREPRKGGTKNKKTRAKRGSGQ